MTKRIDSISCFELLVFDWDGTIADSLGLIVRSVRHATGQLGLPEKSDQQIKDIIGLGLESAMERLYPGISTSDRDALAASYRGFYAGACSSEIVLFPQVEKTLQILRDAGHSMAVATGKSRRGLDRALLDTGLSEYFQYSRCADETFSKPHPQMLQDIMDIFAVERDSVLMIGDSEYDLLMAKNAGVASAAVSYGAQNSEFLLKFEPLTCLHNFSDLPEWLSEMAVNDS
ncbi:MAG: HAD-IA family hydrolase [Gammaproteobacteria bacterium]|nr:HAD-IA family hydrolase [Gammaproteobacteria bacterium]